MKTLIKQAGKCTCGSENIEYGSSDIEGSSLAYRFVCNDCGACGFEYYTLTYETTETK